MFTPSIPVSVGFRQLLWTHSIIALFVANTCVPLTARISHLQGEVAPLKRATVTLSHACRQLDSQLHALRQDYRSKCQDNADLQLLFPLLVGRCEATEAFRAAL